MATMDIKLKIDDDGTEFIGEIAVIGSTELGPESDYRYFVASLNLDLGGSRISYCPIITSPPEEATDVTHSHIMGILKAVGVRTWEELVGKRVMALFDAEKGRFSSPVVGLCSLDGENIYLGEALEVATSP